MHYVRDLLDRTGVIWQTGELGAVDKGGGGTVAMFVAHMNVEVVDVGVPVPVSYTHLDVYKRQICRRCPGSVRMVDYIL